MRAYVTRIYILGYEGRTATMIGGAFSNDAFNNKVIKTDDGVIGETTYVSALQKANRRSLGFLLGTQWV